MTSLKYLCRILTASNYDCPLVLENLRKERNKWARLLKILGQEDTIPWVSGMFFNVVVKAVLMFALEMYVTTHYEVTGFSPVTAQTQKLLVATS